MANMHTIAALKADFAKGGPNEIIANGRQEISGPRLNNVLLNIIDTLDYVLAPEGVGIESIHQNADSSLTFTLTDGTTFTTIPLKGEKGDPPVITADEEGNIYADGQFVTSIIRDTLAQVVSDVDVAVARANEAAQAATQKAALAEAAAGTANTAAAGADAKAALAQAAADNADAKAALANTAAGTANTAASGADTAAANANAKATLANTAAGEATAAADSANIAAATATEKAGLADTAAQTANAAAEAADEAREGIQEDLDKKANKDGWYQTLTSGLAENLVDTKGAGTEQEFTDRTSCGEESIADDGSGIIKELRGNSLVWNQLVTNGDFANGTTGWGTQAGCNLSISGGKLVCTIASESLSAMRITQPVDFIDAHKYLVFCRYLIHSASFRDSVYKGYFGGPTQWWGYMTITDTDTSVTVSEIITASGSHTNINVGPYRTKSTLYFAVGDYTTYDFISCIDLTLMFGPGKEPATVEEFQALYHELYYPQNYGTILNNAAATLITDGFNQWDEEWELGNINIDNGQDQASTTNIRSKNYIEVFPGSTYYCKLGSGTGLRICAYAADKNYISTISGLSSLANTTFQIPSNAKYIRIGTVGYGPNYNHDICINLSWSGYRNGEYEPYWKRVTGMDMRKIYGKLNGAGEMVQVFPDGGRSAGDAYDVAEIFEKKEADVRLGVVDMGTLTYTEGTTGETPIFTVSYLQLADRKSGSANLLCPRYIAVGTTRTALQNADKAIASYGRSTQAISIRDDAYATGAAIKEALNGVPLYYELAEPLHYTDLMYSEDGGQTFTDIPTVFKVADFGTERIEPLVDAQGNPVTAPFRAVIKYSDDFTRTIVNLQKNFDTTGGLDDLLAELSAKLSTALNGTFTIARGAYNPATKKYAWSVSFTPNE